MPHLRSFLAIVRWDFVLELRRREAVLNMTLFAVLILFLAAYGVRERGELKDVVGPLVLWIAVLFAGTVGLARAFAVEREHDALTGVLLSPLDPGVLYLAKVAATWLYVMAMEALLLLAFVVLFDISRWERVPALLGTMAAFTYAYVAAGTTIAALTSGLRGGEVVLRILLFPVMIPVVMVALDAGRWIFPEIGSRSPTGALRHCGALAALGTAYLAAGFFLFPKVVEE